MVCTHDSAVIEPTNEPYIFSQSEDERRAVETSRVLRLGTEGSPPPPGVTLSTLELEQLANRIKTGEPSAMEQLYRLFSRGAAYYMRRHLGTQEIEDRVHDTFLIVVQAIRRGDIRDPTRLMGFVRTVVRRQVASCIDGAMQDRRDRQGIDENSELPADGDPQERILGEENARLVQSVLCRMSKRDQKILSRFYLEEEDPVKICMEMNISPTQFRILKSRARTRFIELGKKNLSRKPIPQFSVRDSTTL